MSRHTEVILNDTKWLMPIKYAVSQKLSREVADPLVLAMKLARGGEFPLTTEDLVSVVYIGVQAAGCQLTRAEVAGAIFAVGPLQFVGVVTDYIKAMISGDPDKQPPESE